MRQTAIRTSMLDAKEIVDDLFQAKPWIYWTDFPLTAACAILSFLWAPMARAPLARAALYVLSVVAWYRAAIFTHELVHLPSNVRRRFLWCWDALCGIPLLVPSFLYDTHLDHHARDSYATLGDGEYLGFANRPRIHGLLFLLSSLVTPLLAVIRFLLLSPLAWSSQRVRRLVDRHASALVIDLDYRRGELAKEARIRQAAEEAACWLYLLVVFGLVWDSVIPVSRLVQAYLTLSGVMFLNSLRTLGAHRYRGAGEPMSFNDQILDSVTYARSAWLAPIWAPVGLRFHALHHMFPSMPYHALGEAHRRLMEHLPEDAPYRFTMSAGLWTSLRELWRVSREKESPRVT